MPAFARVLAWSSMPMKTNSHAICCTLAVFIFISMAVAGHDGISDDYVPVAPISPAEYQGWADAYRLRNDAAELVMIPEIGKIVHLSHVGGANLLHFNKEMPGKVADPDRPDHWHDFGGNWIWPVARPDWHLFHEDDLKRSLLQDSGPWAGRAWRSADGSLYGLMTQKYGDPLNVEVTRTIRLDSTQASISIRQRIERTGPSDIEVSLLNISRMRDSDFVVMPCDGDSRTPDESDRLTPVSNLENMVHCDNTIVYDGSVYGEFRIYSDSHRHWIASVSNGVVMLSRVEDRETTNGVYPFNGSRVAMYADGMFEGVGIGVFGEMRSLDPGESIENTLQMDIFSIPSGLGPCAVADKIREFIGEIEAADMSDMGSVE